MNLLVTNNSYMIVEQEPEYLLKDEVIFKLMTSPEFRIEFLDVLGVKSVIVSRLGLRRNDKVFRAKEITTEEKPNVKFEKEVGYFAKL